MAEKIKGRGITGSGPEDTVGNSRVSAELQANWRELLFRLRESLGNQTVNSWLASLRIVSCVDGRLVMSTSSEFRRERIMNTYHDRIRLLWRQADPSIRSVEIVVEPERPTNQGSRAAALTQSSTPARSVTVSRPNRADAIVKGVVPSARPPVKSSASLLSSSGLDPKLVFDNFVVGTSNELAFASARHVAMEPGKRYTALYLHSVSGFGKTHLLNAIGNEALKQHPELKVVYLPAGSFMTGYGQATRENDSMGFRDIVRSVDLLLLDDLQFICAGGRSATFSEFIQTFKALQEAGKQVVIAADRPASALDGIEEHARSRLCGALTVTITPPDADLRIAILKRKLVDMRASGRLIEIADNVLDYIAHKVDSNPRELLGALACVANNSEVERAETTLEKAQELVQHLVRVTDRRITIEDIQKKVAAFYHVPMRDLLSHRRDRAIVRPRQVAMYLCKRLTTRSLPEIGRRFGNRDHTTVLYGVRRIGEMREQNTVLSDEIELLKRMIEN